MTSKEKSVYELIRQQPDITQNELAQKLNLTRSSVSVHISNLMSKGYIAGRCYILNDKPFVAVIGAANMDILGFSHAAIIDEDSNPGMIKTCAGGVGRNISENLARLNVDVKLISSIGDDVFGETLTALSSTAGIDMSNCYTLSGGTSSTYIAIMNDCGEMALALSDMSALEKLPIDHVRKKAQIIERAQVIAVDACLTSEMIEFIVSRFKDRDIFLDPVSVGKTEHIKPYIGGFHTVKMNMLEAQSICEMPVSTDDELKRAADKLLNLGVRRVFITMGARGVFYKSANSNGIYRAEPIKPLNATGAGDAFMAGLIYAHMQGWPDENTVRFASIMSRFALASQSTVSESLSLEKALSELEKQS